MNARPQSYKRAPRTAKEADRVEYRRQWHLAAKRPAGDPQGDTARAWLADRRAARAAAFARPPRKPYQPRPPRAPLTAEEMHARHERHKEICREYYRSNRAAILAAHAAYNLRPEVKAARVARKNATRAEAAARRADRQAAHHATWEREMLTKSELKKLPQAERIRIMQRQRYRHRRLILAGAMP